MIFGINGTPPSFPFHQAGRLPFDAFLSIFAGLFLSSNCIYGNQFLHIEDFDALGRSHDQSAREQGGQNPIMMFMSPLTRDSSDWRVTKEHEEVN